MKNLSDENLYYPSNESDDYHKESNLIEREINGKMETCSSTIIPNTLSQIEIKENTHEIIIDDTSNGNLII